MQTPDVIYLIDMGDEITWCDDANPSGEIPREDVVRYQKSDFACCKCSHWQEGEYGHGECTERLGSDAEVIIDVMDSGIYKIETEPNFFCAAFEKRGES
jgi:hypothetical protein